MDNFKQNLLYFFRPKTHKAFRHHPEKPAAPQGAVRVFAAEETEISAEEIKGRTGGEGTAAFRQAHQSAERSKNGCKRAGTSSHNPIHPPPRAASTTFYRPAGFKG